VRYCAAMRAHLAAPCLLLVLAACAGPKIESAGSSRDGGSQPPPADAGAPPFSTGSARLEISPDNDVLLIDRGQSATRAFTVTLVRADGTRADVSGRATLGADNAMAGSLTGAVFKSAVMTTNTVLFTRVDASFMEGGETLRARANLTLVWLRTSGDSQDFFFTLPFGGAARSKPLSFTTYIQSIDVFFAVDTTASMGVPIGTLRSGLRDTIIPAVRKAAAKEAWFGVGAIEDFPADPYGVPTIHAPAIDDQPFILVAPMTSDLVAAQAAVDGLILPDFLPSIVAPRGGGGDQPEAHLEALYQIATGEGLTGVASVPAHKGKGKGGVEFREGAQPIIVAITDAPSHTKGEPDDGCETNYAGAVAAAAHTRAQTVQALNAICAKVVGVANLWPGNYYKGPTCTPAEALTRFARDTGTRVPPEAWDVPARPAGCAAGRCCTGQAGAGEAPDSEGLCPLVFKNDNKSNGLGGQVVSGITQLARFGAFDVVAATDGDPLPGGRTTADLIRGVTPMDATPPPPPPTIKPPTVSAGKFTGVLPGTVVRFTIEAKNDVVMETAEPQVFHARIRIRAGGCADLDERDVIILVPPKKPVIL
jgi:hypothetical protein